ncbi:MAG: serine/threonine protein kinase [Deltaproteobacteria bacterium]|nr:serine/threonine protein kinase [Deltaproteobacteria bacterium]
MVDPLAVPAEFKGGQVLGKYRIVRKLGEGGMGAVYEALHERLSKRVVLKVLKPELARHGEAYARFLREGSNATRVRHPNAVDVTDVDEVDGVPFLVMEYLEGENLGVYLKRQRRLEVDTIVELLVPVLAAVSAAHAERLLHRDLKPENIFLARTRDGAIVPKVLDFGISRLETHEGPNLTATNAALGTPAYMSPEQFHSTRDVDLRTDIWALGVILYELSTGRLPFTGTSPYAIAFAVTSGECTPPRQVVPTLPEAFEAVVLRALARDPEARFPTVDAMSLALQDCASTPGDGPRSSVQSTLPDVTVGPPPPSEPAPAALGGTLAGLSGPIPAPPVLPGRRRQVLGLGLGLPMLGLVAWRALTPSGAPASSQAPRPAVAPTVNPHAEPAIVVRRVALPTAAPEPVVVPAVVPLGATPDAGPALARGPTPRAPNPARRRHARPGPETPGPPSGPPSGPATTAPTNPGAPGNY